MNIFEFAKQMEMDGERYYRTLAEQSDSIGLRKIFTMLADEEVKHFRIVDRMSQRTTPELVETEILDRVKNVFADMKDTEPHPHIDSTVATKNYRKARDIEEKSRDFYLEQADKTENVIHAAIFHLLALEEGKHLQIMENIVEFISRPEPGNWLENAEWHHLDAY